MKGILADVNIQGHVDLLVILMQAEPWKLFWDYLQLPYLHFADVGLAPNTPDSLVWETCQREELVLVTDNRNRTVAAIRNVFTRSGGSLGETNSVAWMFNDQGVIRVAVAGRDAEEIASWTAGDGDDLRLTGYTRLSPSEIRRVEVRWEKVAVLAYDWA